MRASVIIPSYNACERLYNNLLSLNMQSCDRDKFEVIVVDDGSKDNTKNLLANFRANYEIKKVILKENKGRSTARNIAIDEARGDILIFHDSDMIAEKDYVSKHIDAHGEGGTVVSGMNWRRIFTYYYKEFTEKSKDALRQQLEKMGKDKQYSNLQPIIDEADIMNGKCFDYSFLNSNYQNRENSILEAYGSNLEEFLFPWTFFVTNNCSAFRKDILDVGAFDSSYRTWGCEDLDLGYRLYKKNCRFIKAINIESIHQEHPVYLHRDLGENIYSFTNKYNTIDLLLFYYGKYAGVDRHQASSILLELEELRKEDRYERLIDLYRKLLICLRDRDSRYIREKDIKEMRETRQSIISDVNDCRVILEDLKKESMFSTTMDSIKTLLKRYFGPYYVKINI